MMGAGKSAVGAVLARRLACPFVDTDERIERSAGLPIERIFAELGEPAFRRLERDAISAVSEDPAVVALGGGAIAEPGAPERLAARGIVVYLRASPERLAERLEREPGARERPLLAGLDAAGRVERLRELLARREAAYRTAAIQVDTDARGVEEVAADVERRLRRHRAATSGASVQRTVQVPLGDRSYPICIGVGTLGDAGGEIARLTKATRVAIVTVPAVRRRYAARLARSLRAAGLRSDVFEVPDGERSKTLRRAASLYEAFLAAGLDRSAAVVALGGGMVGDLAGFAAATYLRGVPFVQVPTTLLAMVDASVGGKVGVNLAQGKNLVGAFWQPRLVWIDAATLESLPARQRSAGMAEVIKHAAIWDPALFASLEAGLEAALRVEPEVIVPVLEANCAIKAEVVSRDEREQDLRMLLNFGHTLAHAVERLTGYGRQLHGEAVAAGMAYAARRSEELGLAPAGTAGRLVTLLERAALPTALPDRPRGAYLAALKVDKKKLDARIRYVVLRRIGGAETLPLTPAEILPSRSWRQTAGIDRRAERRARVRRTQA
jgi:3-dehydroquinate synthase